MTSENSNITELSARLAALAVAARAGDREAYRAFLRETRRWVLGAVRQRIRDPALVEDIGQDVLLKVHLALHTFDPERPFLPWLAAIVRNAVTDHLRQIQRAPVGASEEELARFGSPSNVDAALLLREFVSELSNDQKVALQKVHLRQSSYRDAAEEVGITEVAMKVRVHRVYQAFKRKFSG